MVKFSPDELSTLIGAWAAASFGSASSVVVIQLFPEVEALMRNSPAVRVQPSLGVTLHLK